MREFNTDKTVKVVLNMLPVLLLPGIREKLSQGETIHPRDLTVVAPLVTKKRNRYLTLVKK
jgi:hypothetical protein